MNKVVLKDLEKVKITEEVEVTLLNEKILIKNYLPMEQKLNLIESVMQNSIEFNFVNPMKVETYFNVYMVLKYTNIDFSEYLSDIPNLYDLIERTGILQTVIDTVGSDYDELWDFCNSFTDKYENYQNSLYGVITQILSDIPEKLGEALDELARLDMSKLQNVFKEVSETGGSTEALVQTVFGKDNSK